MISVVSPVYLGERFVEKLVRRIGRHVERITPAYEIVLVDDGSPDDSWGRIREACERDPRVRGIRLSRNFGQHYALTAALEAARGEYVIVMDCDLQDDPAYIPQLYEAAQAGFDVVYTCKRRRAHRGLKNLLGRAFHRLFNLLAGPDGLRSRSEVGNYSLLRRRVVDAFTDFNDYHRHYLAVLRWLGFSSTSIEIDHRERADAGTSYTFGKLFREAINGITANTDRLLHASIAVGFVFFLLALVGVIYVVTAYVLRGFQEGWASVIVVILTSTGVILMSLGVLGIYLGKTFEQAKGRPLYVVSERLNAPAAEKPMDEATRSSQFRALDG